MLANSNCNNLQIFCSSADYLVYINSAKPKELSILMNFLAASQRKDFLFLTALYISCEERAS